MKTYEMCALEVHNGEGITKNDVTELLRRTVPDELLPIRCCARKKSTAAVGFIGVEFAKFLHYDYRELQNFVASVLDSPVPNDENVYDFHGRKILIERI